MNINEIIRLPDQLKHVNLEIKEVIRDIGKKPHVFIRVRMTGWHFPERAPEPFVVIDNAISKFVIISNDGSIADAYFDTRLPAAKQVSFGYGNIVSWDFDVSVNPRSISSLDRSKLPKGSIDLRR